MAPQKETNDQVPTGTSDAVDSSSTSTVTSGKDPTQDSGKDPNQAVSATSEMSIPYLMAQVTTHANMQLTKVVSKCNTFEDIPQTLNPPGGDVEQYPSIAKGKHHTGQLDPPVDPSDEHTYAPHKHPTSWLKDNIDEESKIHTHGHRSLLPPIGSATANWPVRC
ncbi:hypothetical protein M422DRAFT_247684 [Sphaerobolus stellatus SS14]|nr:hypothetical protein M422DRAFT_247684 [Sphaerobolus stellatus SS14]